jgi:subtilisin family serine protease
MRALRRLDGWLLALFCIASATRARAQVDLGAFGRAFARTSPLALKSSPIGLPRAFSSSLTGGVPVIVRSASGPISGSQLTPLGRFAIANLQPEALALLANAHPDWSFDWAPPRHVLLDRVDGWVHAASVRQQTGFSGQGVVVGVVDTGVDLGHGDLRTSDHKTRVAWLIDVSRAAAGVHPDLEIAYGCDSRPGCAIFSAADLDVLEANSIAGDEPTDLSGHGTHVASLAAGNGLSSSKPVYVGMAPEATLIVARVAQQNGAIEDSDVLRSVKFVFDRAADLGLPAVVNLSLGSDFGAHDGSSALESELSGMVGADFPGRAIVVAAGNSAGLFVGVDPAYPEPLGIHTEVHVARDSVSLVPLITPSVSDTDDRVQGSAYVWIGFRPGDEVSVGLDDGNGGLLSPVHVGEVGTIQHADLEVTIFNGTQGLVGASSFSPGRTGAVLILNGMWLANSGFKIHLEGHGSAQLWVQGSGDLDSETHIGALFPRGQREGTINVPASASSLIAVGATLNRTQWVDSAGTLVNMPGLGSLTDAPLDTVAYFSSGGPNALGALKPDIVAPGVSVAGALASFADPRSNGGVGMFAGAGRCAAAEECFVVDDTHAITSGTSMSAPIVSGAIALLFERDKTLTSDSVRALLQAGARPVQGVVLDDRQLGVGALDIAGSFRVATAGDSPALRVPGAQSWLALSESYVHPDPNWQVVGFLELRDDSGNVADGFLEERLRLSVEGAVFSEQFQRLAPGFYGFSVAAKEGSGGGMVHIRASFDGQIIATRDLPIAVDRSVAESGVSLRGGCAAARALTPANAEGSIWGAAALVLTFAYRRRARRHMLAK